MKILVQLRHNAAHAYKLCILLDTQRLLHTELLLETVMPSAADHDHV